ncbi:hypothetical protein [Crassaminicella indica]|uniref:Nuclease-related domain-containing protein n=1 Tax=Crassaminicella indica TaxID=2855394 RepID=A0ABX8REG8_9CLOT|nr:hypothetical protein [Crassaminicella indica]QXM06789.1 hypothetical protein KVH43_03440 [Crassaminicella indica]
MEQKIFIDENGVYKINCTSAIELIELHDYYNKNNLLSDVDFIMILDEDVIFVEYKNNTIPEVKNPKAFEKKITTEDHYKKIARKYYDSLIYIRHRKSLTGKTYKYYYILECDKADSVMRKRLATKIKKKLPFELQTVIPNIDEAMIDDFKVVNIEEWNKLFPSFKLEQNIG